MTSERRLSWTQPQCEQCWIDAEGEWSEDGTLRSVRQPVRLVDPDNPKVEQCAWCGCPTIVGIFRRVDPTTVPYPAEKSANE